MAAQGRVGLFERIRVNFGRGGEMQISDAPNHERPASSIIKHMENAEGGYMLKSERYCKVEPMSGVRTAEPRGA